MLEQGDKDFKTGSANSTQLKKKNQQVNVYLQRIKKPEILAEKNNDKKTKWNSQWMKNIVSVI